MTLQRAPIPLQDPIATPRDMKVPRGREDPEEGLIAQPWVRWFTGLGEDQDASQTRIGSVALTGQSATLATTAIDAESLSAGLYTVQYYARITTAATTSSSLTVTLSWTDGGVACSRVYDSTRIPAADIAGNTTSTTQTASVLVRADATTPISYSTTYASVGATAMQYSLYIVLQRADV